MPCTCCSALGARQKDMCKTCHNLNPSHHKGCVMKNAKTWSTICLAALFLSILITFRESSGAAVNENKVRPGEFIIDHPTLINLGFEWLIEGDDNRNAQVEVSYRKQGQTQW